MAVSFIHDQILMLLMEASSTLRGESTAAAMEDKLERFQAAIDDAERRAEREEDKERVKQVRVTYFSIEDLMDECMIREEQQRRDPGCEAILCAAVDFIKTLSLRVQINHEIQIIELRVGEIRSYSEYQGPSSSRDRKNATLLNLRQAPLYMDEAEIVSFGDQDNKLIKWLIDGPAERTAISVVGMGGQGKTSLARKVYQNHVVVQHFHPCAWITVSQSYNLEGLLKDMLRQLTGRDVYYSMSRGSLIDAARDFLKHKRYVIVFDDVWDPHFWDSIECVLIDNRSGSRILITTRNMDVALFCKRFCFVQVHQLEPLTLDQSMELFYKTTFRYDFDGGCPEELKHISYDIVKKCNGLPLAIVAVGGVLSCKERNLFEWKYFSQNLSSVLGTDLNFIGITIGLGYDDLPNNLKLCLLYFGMYPQYFEIKSKRLIRHWIAEGFVKRENGKTLEEVAYEYLRELIGRNLVQASSFSIDDKAKGSRLHGLMHEMILRRAEDSSFCQAINEDDPSYLSGKTFRRLSIETIPSDLMSIAPKCPRVRSLLFFIEKEFSEILLRQIFSKYKLVRVLDFESSTGRSHYVHDVPESLGNLILLKYLSFRGIGIQSLPSSIGNLFNLETLDLRQTAVTKIPREVTKLRKLRHLLGSRMSWTQLKYGIGGMTELQTLSEVQIDEDEVEPIRELGKLTGLRKFSLIDVREEQVSVLCYSINEMHHLEKLYIETISKDEAIHLHFVSNTPPLQKLRLKAKLNKVPEWIPKLPYLVELSLSHSKLADDLLKPLKDLPNLLLLNLAIDSYEGFRLHFQEGWFLKLKELGLRYLRKLNSIIIDKGALRSLKELTLMSIPKLKTAPEGIQHLEKLEVLNIHFMSNEFEQSMTEITKTMNLRK